MDFSAKRLLAVLERHSATGRYWVAYSGGLDSGVLLHALAAVRSQLAAPLQAIHLDHGLQPDSPRWADHCREQCRVLEIPLVERELRLSPAPGESVEAAAREARLAAFRAILSPEELLLTAQHGDDQAETLLLQLLRGSGLSGLAAMPELAELSPGWLVRPLLGFGREQLRAYADANGLCWVEDPSNAETGFDRNYLRHRVIPLLAERWPACAGTLSRSARHCAEAQGLIDHLAEDHYQRVRSGRPGTLKVSALIRLEPPLCRALLRRWIRQEGFRVPDSRRLDRIVQEVLPAAADRSPLVEWPGVQVRRYRDELFVISPLPEPPADVPIDWSGGTPLDLPGRLGRLRLDGPAAAPLQVRFGVAGARCPMAGGGRKGLKKLFQELAVPDWVRPYVPLIYRNGALAAVGGLHSCAGGVAVAWEAHPFQQVMS